MAEGLGLSQFTTLVAPVAEDAGGSFVARNLAATFTLQGRAALIIECNFRRPSQSEALRATSDSDGLFEFLARTDEERVALPIWPTVIPGLFLIPAGRCEATFAGQIDFLSSSSMKVLLSKVRDYPCNVVLDAPPAIGSPDARILAELADFVVLVVGAGRSTVQDIASAAERFDRKKLAGVAFNQYAGVRRPR
jgi:Mrp family chromosome partitioning ATPase